MHQHPVKGGGGARPRWDVAEIFSRHGDRYLRSHRTTYLQRRAIKAIVQCRTPALGGHAQTCRSCNNTSISYNSCRNRHCPKCQSFEQLRWIRAREARVLPVKYFHVVFTLPQQLRRLCQTNPELMYSLLSFASGSTLLDAAQSKLECQLAITSVLHTWTRDLRFHPHVHCIVSAGGLSPDSTKWISSSGQYLLPVRLLSRLFRGKFLDGLPKLVMAKELEMSLADLRQLKRALFETEWVVYSKKPFAGPSAIFRYLGQYTHRVGIANHRIRSITCESVVFGTKDGKVARLDPIEFMRRFLCHVLPRGFVKIRHYGLAAAANLNGRMARARCLLAGTPTGAPLARSASPPPRQTWKELLEELTGIDVDLCDSCRARAIANFASKLVSLPNTS